MTCDTDFFKVWVVSHPESLIEWIEKDQGSGDPTLCVCVCVVFVCYDLKTHIPATVTPPSPCPSHPPFLLSSLALCLSPYHSII